MLGEILELCVLMLSSGLGVLFNVLFCATALLVNVELGDCFKEVAFVLLVEESGDKNARAPENGDLLDLLSDADDKQLSELDMISSASTSFSSFIFLPSTFPWPLSFSFPSPICSSTFWASLEMSPFSVFSWSQIMEASMLLLCSDPGDDEGLNDSQPGPGADLIGEVHFPALHPNNGFWLPLDPADCPYRGSAGEDKVALKVEIFDFGFSNRFSPGFSTVSDDFFKDAFSNKSSLLRWETLPKGVAPCNVLLEDASSEENFCKSTLLSTLLLLSSLASSSDKRS